MRYKAGSSRRLTADDSKPIQSVSSQLVIALAGGAVGSVLTAVSTAVIRYGAVPAEVRHNDRQIAEIDRDLDRFAADEYTRLRNVELPKLLHQGGLEKWTAASDRSITMAREWALMISWSMQLYRDHENAQMTTYREIVASEGRLHWAYRRIHPRHKRLAELTTPERAAAFLDRWRKLTVASGEKVHMPDPRNRSIAHAMHLLDQEETPLGSP
jgi:hypothetical protein